MQKNLFFKRLLGLSFLSTILALTIGFVIDFISNKIGDINLITAGVIVFLVALFSALLGVSAYSSYMDKQLEDKIDILKTFIDSHGLGNIINEKTLTIWEKSAQSIWVVTLDLSNDIGIESNKKIEKEIVKTVSENLSKGKKYIYFVPDTPEIRGGIIQYKKTHNKFYKNGQVKFCIIPKNQFHFINEIVLYDVKENAPTRAVQWFPNKKLNYYLEIDEYYQTNLIGVLDYMIKTYKLENLEEL